MADLPSITGDVVGPGDNRPIPSDVSARINEVRDAQLDALERAADAMDMELGRAARDAIDTIKASGYKPAVIRAQAQRIVANTTSVVRRNLAIQIQDAALYADRADEVMRAWEIRAKLEGGTVPPQVSASDVRRARVSTKVGTDASLAREQVAALRRPITAEKALAKYASKAGKQPIDPRFTGDKAIQKLRKATAEKPAITSGAEQSLSRRLHGSAASNLDDVNRGLGRVIRELDNYDHAQRVLIKEAQVGAKVELTGPLKDLRDAGRRLARASAQGNQETITAAQKAWEREYGRIERLALKFKDERGGYRELLQDLNGSKVKRLDHALDKWLAQKQRYVADRIVKTETAAAYRSREYRNQSKNKYITGAYWRLNQGGRRGYAGYKKADGSYVPGRTKPTRAPRLARTKWKKGRRCVCELLSDNFYSMAAIRDYPRMGHPHCLCWWEWTYDRSELVNGEVTKEDIDWYNSLPK